MAAPTPGTLRLLVAEADPDLQQTLQQALAEAGYACMVVSSLEEALRLLEQQPCDLVLTDVFIRANQDLRAPLTSLRPLLAVFHPLPVLVCTAWPLEEAEVRQAGFAGLIRRPFALEHPLTTVAACLQPLPSPGQPPAVDTAP